MLLMPLLPFWSTVNPRGTFDGVCMKLMQVSAVLLFGGLKIASEAESKEIPAFISFHSKPDVKTGRVNTHAQNNISLRRSAHQNHFLNLIGPINTNNKVTALEAAHSSEIITTTRGDLIFPPIHSKGEPKSLILIPGAEISPENYAKLAKTIQTSTQDQLWVGITQLEMPVAKAYIMGQSIPLVALEDYINPSTIDKEIQSVFNAMRKVGMPSIKPYIAGHSLGGAFLHHAVEQRPDAYAGMVHLASFLPRYLDQESHPAMQLPALTICAELDGLIGVMRFAEAFYRQVTQASDFKQPVVVVEGMNHSQFCDGAASPFMKNNDLNAENSLLESQKVVADLIGDFIHNDGKVFEDSLLANTLMDSQQYFQPLIASLQFEGSYHLQPPCSSLDDPQHQNCWQGSPWVEAVTPIVTGAKKDGIDLQHQDEFNPSWVINIPGIAKAGKPLFHHPSLTHVEASKDQAAPYLMLNTVSEAVYDPLDFMDLGVIPSTASKIRAKFPSRQAVNHKIGNKLNFPDSELPNIASRMNQLAIDWALDHAPPKARQRYLEKGIKLVAGQDIAVNTGPDWIWSDFDKRLTQDANGHPTYVIDATIMKTPLDNGLEALSLFSPLAREKADELIGGKHFMTLLSPASAMAHICTDSLRSPKPIADKLL